MGRLTVAPLPLEHRREHILLADSPTLFSDLRGYAAVVTPLSLDQFVDGVPALPVIHSVRDTEDLRAGYIVLLSARAGMIRTLYRPESSHNAIFVTDRCNNHCLMCSQPPIDRLDNGKVEQNLRLIELMDPAPEVLGITGGEPTLLGEGLFAILRSLRDKLPGTAFHMLTNGRLFARPDFTEEFVKARPPRLSLGVPLHSSLASDHDYIAQARHAFDQTVMGLHRLARYRQDIEIRVVVTQLNANGLPDLADFLYRNLPFVRHVAFMGLELCGLARRNLSRVWMDPADYAEPLEAAVEYLSVRGMDVSVYNHQLCVLPRRMWRFARRSISDHKIRYVEECAHCDVRERCGGFFSTSDGVCSRQIRAIGPVDLASSDRP